MGNKVFKSFIAAALLISSISLASNKSESKKITELEARVKEILSRDNISRRPDVNDIFELADLYAIQGNISKAREMYEAGLSIDSFRFEYQLKCANLMKKAGDVNQAIEKYKSVYTYCEDEEDINKAKEQLLSLKADCPSQHRKKVNSKLLLFQSGNSTACLLMSYYPNSTRPRG